MDAATAAIITGPASIAFGATLSRYFGQTDKSATEHDKAIGDQLRYLRNEVDRMSQRLEKNSSRIAGITAVLRFIHPELRDGNPLSGDS